MGVSLKNSLNNKKGASINVITFIGIQGHWGHKKEKSLQCLNNLFLGTRNNFNVFNSENSLQYFKRLSLFCFNIIVLGGNVLFVNTSNYFEKITLFLGLRSLEYIKINNWVNGCLINQLYKKPSILFISSTHNNMYILKEASKKSIPVISIQDSDINVDKISYSLLGNDDSKETFTEYSRILSDVIIKAKLFKQCKQPFI